MVSCDTRIVSSAGTERPVSRVRQCGEAWRRRASQQPPVLAVAGIADPDRFFDDLRAAGWVLAEAMTFRDHHRFTARDVGRIMARACQLRAGIVTTEKDLVRLLPYRPFGVPVTHVPMTVEPHPIERFREWIAGELAAIRGEAHG